jgi:hypothetical protein
VMHEGKWISPIYRESGQCYKLWHSKDENKNYSHLNNSNFDTIVFGLLA